jgi:serine/threonine protein phosphatase PrpC
LPFGIDELPENYEYELEDNDLILMSSDGIFENIIEEKELEEFLF